MRLGASAPTGVAVLAAAIWLSHYAPSAPAQPQPQPQPGSVRLVVQNSPLAGLRYYAASRVWPLLQVGDRVDLVREPDNPHDARAVRVDWQGRKLGYIPRSDNDALAWGLDRGEHLQARIRALESRRALRLIEVEVYVE